MSEALGLFYGLVLEDGRRIGEAATDFQREDAEAVLEQNSSTPNHFLTRPRGDSKTSDLAGHNIAVGLAQAPHRSRMYALAADEKQGRLLVDAMAGFVSRTPGAPERPRDPGVLRSLPPLGGPARGARGRPGVDLGIAAVLRDRGRDRPVALDSTTAALLGGGVDGRDQGSRLQARGADDRRRSRALEQGRARPCTARTRSGGFTRSPGRPTGSTPFGSRERRRRLPESSFRRLFLNEWTASETASQTRTICSPASLSMVPARAAARQAVCHRARRRPEARRHGRGGLPRETIPGNAASACRARPAAGTWKGFAFTAG